MTTELQASFRVRACPFCGIATEVPHESQEGCIDALHDEITRMRGILEQVRHFPSDPSTPEDPPS